MPYRRDVPQRSALTVYTPVSVDYRSPDARLGLVARLSPGLRFYPGLARIVWRASRKARRGVYDDRQWVGSSMETVRLLEAVGARLHIENMAVVAAVGRPAVYIGNHMSTLETFVLPAILRPHGPLTFVVKRQLVEMPVFKHIMRSRQPVVVGRANPRDDLKVVLEEGEARLRAGMSVVVFPQTTRAADWAPDDFNTIGVKLARRAGAPIVPLALRSDAWGIGARFKDCGPIRPGLPVRFAFGEPLVVTGNGREQHEAVVRFLAARMAAWGVPTRAAAPGIQAAGEPASAAERGTGSRSP